MTLRKYHYGVIYCLYPIIPICSSIRPINYITKHNIYSVFSQSNSINFTSHDKIMTSERFIDIGANLQDPMFNGYYNGKKRHESDIHRVLDRAKERGVEKIIITSGSLNDLKEALSICDTFDENGGFLYTTVGVHPCMCLDFIPKNGTSEESHSKKYLDDLINLAKSNINRIVAVGEFGLDFDRLGYCDRQNQLKFFEYQMKLLDEFQLPLFLHMRNATDETIDILKKYRNKWEAVGGVCHSFTGSNDCLQKVLDLGLHIGINGCSLKTMENLENIRRIPLDRLHFETDSPWCGIKKSHASYESIKTVYESVNKTHLVDKNPNCTLNIRNEPCNMRQVAEVVYSVGQYNIDFTELCNKVRNNTLKLFTHIQ